MEINLQAFSMLAFFLKNGDGYCGVIEISHLFTFAQILFEMLT
jgi:hypothetical protein